MREDLRKNPNHEGMCDWADGVPRWTQGGQLKSCSTLPKKYEKTPKNGPMCDWGDGFLAKIAKTTLRPSRTRRFH
jgi:hypothetical protein